MRLGMFMMPVHPPGRTFWSTLEEDSEKSVLADALGFDDIADDRVQIRAGGLWRVADPVALEDLVVRNPHPATRASGRTAIVRSLLDD